MSEFENGDRFAVYVANLGKYNEGESVGAWLELPVSQAELDRFLSERLGLELDPQVAFEKGMRGEPVYEEYAIHDTDISIPDLDIDVSEYSNLSDLNILAATLADHQEVNLEAVSLCADQIASDITPLQYANLIIQADEIPYYSYDFFGIEHSGNWSNEEKFGYTLLEDSPVREYLEEHDMFGYFDVEKYGRDNSQNCTLTDDGYLDNAADFPDVDFYDRDELKEIIEDERGEDFFQSLKEVKEKEAKGVSLADRANDAKAISADMAQDAPQRSVDIDAR